VQISDHMHGGVLVLSLEGRMNFQVRKVFQCAMKNAKLFRPQQIILNFYNVPSMDRAGMGFLRLAYKSLGKTDIRLSIEVFKGYVQQVLALANIGKTIPISTTTAKQSTSGFTNLGTIPRNA